MFDIFFDLYQDMLADPRGKQRLRLASRADVEALGLTPIARTPLAHARSEPVGKTDVMLLAEDGGSAFSVVDGMPVLLWPDVFTDEDQAVDLNDRIYVEAYTEMSFYNARAGAAADEIDQRGAVAPSMIPFRDDQEARASWSDYLLHDGKAVEDAFDYLAPVQDSDFVQLGGDGRFAIKALRGGARRALLITPMLAEARHARAMARLDGVEDRLLCVIGLGEELPLQDAVVDKLFSPACMHHMRLDQAFPQMKAALKPGGRFAAFDPWRAPLYGVGSAVFGKRNTGLFDRSAGVMCRPLTEDSLAALDAVFPHHVRRHHGPLLRYPLCACEKLGLRLPQPAMRRIADLDDRLGQMLHLSPTWGSSLMLGGEA